VAGAISKDGSQYRLDVRMLNPAEPADKQVLLSWDTRAADKNGVLPAVGRMAARLREGLGDASADSDKVRDEESFTAASLDAARAYTTAQELQWAGKYDEAYASYQRASELDPNMGRAYAGLGAVAANLGRREDADKYYKLALARLGRMTDREKFRTRGGYYLFTRNADKARDEWQALVKQYPADSAGLINLALAEFNRRDMARAVELGKQASALLPRNVLRKNNTALFAMYAGDFDLAVKEASGVLEINPEFAKAYVAVALSKLASGDAATAEAGYRKLMTLPGSAGWFAVSGLADLAMAQGRLTEAAAVLEPAIAAEKDASRQARLIVTLAEVRQLQEKPRDAAALAKRAIARSTDESIAFLAGRVLAASGQSQAALDIVKRLLERLDPESLSQARVLEGEVALADGDPRKAIERFRTARQFADSWLGRFGLGRAYLAAGAFPEADSEFDLCLKRRGEATAALLDDVPSYRLAVPLSYYRARVHQELGSPDARELYEGFLQSKQGGDEQGLVADARKRLASLP
jgi:tetratricopeptide (TPR) repeat protein